MEQPYTEPFHNILKVYLHGLVLCYLLIVGAHVAKSDRSDRSSSFFHLPSVYKVDIFLFCSAYFGIEHS